MSLNRGTIEGEKQEKICVSNFNKNKFSNKYSIYHKFLNQPLKNVYLIRVTTKQYSKLSNQKVMTRSDAYAIKSIDEKIRKLLIDNNYYLDEDIIKTNSITHELIPYSGISIKLCDSSKFQILKLTSSSFKTLFIDSELGAGASLYCKKEEELPKNVNLISGWLSSIEEMVVYFDDITLGNNQFYFDKKMCQAIKTKSIKIIEERINFSQIIQEKIFNGKYLYEEPYTAFFFLHHEEIKELKYIPFSITTGSGRSHGDYTLVLKPR